MTAVPKPATVSEYLGILLVPIRVSESPWPPWLLLGTFEAPFDSVYCGLGDKLGFFSVCVLRARKVGVFTLRMP